MNREKQHIFVSYSRRDSEFMQRIVEDLQKMNLPVWVDSQSLSVGTPDWEHSIRDAISNAFAIILVASPDARQSVYVQGELTIAKNRQCPIYPVWVRGNDWIECVSLDMIRYQYIDCRGEKFTAGLNRLINTFQTLINIPVSIPDGYFGITLLDEIKILSLNTDQNVYEMLSDFFVNHLQYRYEPYTYGIDWVLVNVKTNRVVVPWKWLFFENRNRPTHQYDHELSHAPLDNFGIISGTHWKIVTGSNLSAAGFAVKNISLFEQLNSVEATGNALSLYKEQHIKPLDVENISIDQYQYRIVLAMSGLGFRSGYIEV